MKRFILLAILVIAAASCEKGVHVDYPVVGNISITGISRNSSTSSWYPGEQIGLFVSSEGFPQNNLLYTPSETCKDESIKVKGKLYHMYGIPVGNTSLNPQGEAVAFKHGEHTIYGYSPYNPDAKDITAVPMPDLTKQDNVSFIGNVTDPSISFVWAKKTIKEYTTANLALGTFKNEDQSLNTGAISFTDHDLVGKKVTKVIISADKDIAYQNPTFNLMEGKINGEPSSIEVITDLEIVTATFGAIETSDPVRFVVACSIDDLKNTTFTFDAYIENDIYTCSARPKVTEISGFTIVSFEDLLNMVKK